MVKVFESPHDLSDAVGAHLGYSHWLAVDQARIDLFAEATGDHPSVHTGPVRAGDGPFGTTIAHGYLTLALSNMLLPQVLDVRGISMGINYGTNRVRFPAPVPEGSRLRAGAELVEVDEVAGGYQAVVRITMEIEGQERPACVVDSVSRFIV